MDASHEAERDTLMGDGIAAPVASFARGRYQAQRVLGIGGQKLVYLVHDAELDRACALALLRADGMGAGEVERLRGEARAVARLGAHPNLVTVYDIGEENGYPFVVSEFVEGGDLRETMRRAPGPLSLERALALCADVLEALRFVHAKGVVHRDIKPPNIWLTPEGKAKLGDFGIAMTRGQGAGNTGNRVVGTPGYMAPEQVTGPVVDARADLYAVGCVLFELLTGSPVFTGNAMRVLMAHVSDRPPAPSELNPSVPAALDRLVADLLEKQAEDRPADASEVMQRLREIALDVHGQGAEPAADVPARASVRDVASPSTFVGRRAEIERLRTRLGSALSGHGAFVALVGDPGVGKSRLCGQLAFDARLHGASVLSGRCSDTEGAPPYLPIVEILEDLIGQPSPAVQAQVDARAEQLRPLLRGSSGTGVVPDGRAGETERYAMFEAVAAVIDAAARASGLVLVLEDLHLAGRPTMLLLRHLVRRLVSSRVLVVGTMRSSELGGVHPISELLADLGRERLVDRIELAGLEPADGVALIEAIAPELPETRRREVLRATAGNPFFIEELVRHLSESGRFELPSTDPDQHWIPAGVRDVVSGRIAKLSEGARKMLTGLSVVRDRVSWAEITSICDGDEDELLDHLDAALEAHLIREHKDAPGHYSFAHALVQQILYDGMSTPRRARLHLRSAEALEALREGRDSNARIAELAHHFSRAAATLRAATERALDYSTRAGERSLRRLAFEDAAAHFGRALAFLETLELDTPRHRELAINLHIRRAEMAAATYGWREAAEDYQAALKIVAEEDLPRRGRLHIEMAWALFWAMDVPAMAEHAQRAKEIAEATQDKELLGFTIGLMGVQPQMHGDLEGALAMYERAREVAGHHVRPMSHTSITLYWLGRSRAALASSDEALELASLEQDALTRMFVLPHRALAQAALARYGPALATFASARGLGDQFRTHTFVARTMAMEVGFRIELLDYASAETHIEQALEMANTVAFGPSIISAELDRLSLYLVRGELDAAERSIRELEPKIAGVKGWHSWVWSCRLVLLRGRFALARADHERALALADETIERGTGRRPKYVVWGQMLRGQAFARLGREDLARRAAAAAIELADADDQPLLALHARWGRMERWEQEEDRARARHLVARIVEGLEGTSLGASFLADERVRGLVTGG